MRDFRHDDATDDDGLVLLAVEEASISGVVKAPATRSDISFSETIRKTDTRQTGLHVLILLCLLSIIM
jgi:hypothetical protein